MLEVGVGGEFAVLDDKLAVQWCEMVNNGETDGDWWRWARLVGTNEDCNTHCATYIMRCINHLPLAVVHAGLAVDKAGFQGRHGSADPTRRRSRGVRAADRVAATMVALAFVVRPLLNKAA